MTSPLTLPWRATRFGCWFALAVVKSAWDVVSDVLTPGLSPEPRVVRMPLESTADAHVTLIASLITLTPGTLTLGIVSRPTGRRELLVHSMYHGDQHEALRDLRDMEERMLDGLSLRRTP